MKRKAKYTQLCASLLFALPAFASDPSTVEDRIKKVEDQLNQVLKENSELKKELGYDGKSPLAFLKPGGKESKISLGGFVQANAEFGEAPDSRWTTSRDRFLLRRARVNVAGAFAEHFDFKLEADFGANSLGEKSNSSGQLTDAFINWNLYDFANVKIGQFKTPFGYEQLVSDTKLLTIERSLPNDRLTDGRQIGVAVGGDTLEKRLCYSAGLFNGSGVNNSYNDNDNFMFAGRVSGVPFQGKIGKQDARWAVGLDGLITEDDGISKNGFGFDSTPASAAKDNLFTGERSSWGVDSQFKWGIFGLEAEYLRSHFEPSDKIPNGSFDADGWYVLGTCFIVPTKLQALAKYESFDPNTSVGGDDSHDITLGLNYLIKGDDIKLSVNYLIGDPAGTEDNPSRLLTRVQIIF